MSADTENKRAPQGRVNWRNLLTLGSLTLLVGTEVMGAAIAGGWAVAGLLELGTTIEYAFMVIFGCIGLWAMTAFVRSAMRVEPVLTR